jgi:7,8-dihydropterin-6-yl-methyl-4-(beta-D-ribofuranosyl)aminobenzene 5'-phosphate synthase
MNVEIERVFMSKKVEITLLYDKPCLKNFQGGWGLSFWIEFGNEKILFDTGWNGEVLLSNCVKKGKNVEDLTYIFLSHIHWDHIGGTVYLLNQKFPKLKGIILPKTFSKVFKSEISEMLGPIIEIPEIPNPVFIEDGIWSSGVMGKEIKEHSLLLQLSSDNVLIVAGCSHPSPILFLKSAQTLAPVYGIMGGLHGFKEIEKLKNLELIVPIHCTKKQGEIRNRFPSKFQMIKVGETIKIEG